MGVDRRCVGFWAHSSRQTPRSKRSVLAAIRTSDAPARYSLNSLHLRRRGTSASPARRMELCVTQAAVSQQIKALEAQVGKPLFLRTARACSSSDEGARLAPPCSKPFAQLDAAPEPARRQPPPERRSPSPWSAPTCTAICSPACPTLRLATPHRAAPVNPQQQGRPRHETPDAAIRFGDGAWRSVEAPAPASRPAHAAVPSIAARCRQPGRPARPGRPALPLRCRIWPAWGQAAGQPESSPAARSSTRPC